MKRHLSIACLYNHTTRWIDFLPKICDNFNSTLYPHTSFKRNTITRENYLQFLSQLHHVGDASLLFNTYTMNNFSPEMAKDIYRYAIGQRVLIRRKILSMEPKEIKSLFAKASVTGTFNPRVFIISERYLKHTRDTFLTPVYKVDGLDQNFYEADLKKVTFKDDE